MNRDSKIWLSKNIKLDKEYKAVLKYDESAMISLMEQQANLVYYNNKYQFLRENEDILVACPYGTCLQANYLAFQNPDYSNKIFFAFIDSVEYVSESTTRIKYTIDVWTTWYSYWSAKSCYVIREHVTDDTRGLHTIPENLETGEYVSANNELGGNFATLGDNCYVIALTEQYSISYRTLNEKLPSGLYYYAFTSLSDVYDVIDDIQNDDVINSIFVAPKTCFDGWTNMNPYIGQVSTAIKFACTTVTKEINFPTSLNGYTPKNKKLLCYPYSFLAVNNHAGATVIYHWEDFNNVPQTEMTKATFVLRGVLGNGCSGYCEPLNYKNRFNDYIDGIAYPKFPIGGYSSDTYTNWITQNGVNNTIGVVGGAITAGLGIAGAAFTGGASLALAGAVLGGGISIASSIGNIYQHSLAPDQARGNTNTGDYNYYFDEFCIEFTPTSIRSEYARVIDDYFTRMGYKVNRIKVPNMAKRQNYNYVQIASDDSVAYVNNHNNICPPAKDLDQINNLFRRGITIWNNHNNLGDYSVSNNITST